MSTARYHVTFSYRKIGSSGGWEPSALAGSVHTASETLVMQELRNRHPGCEIKLKELVWK